MTDYGLLTAVTATPRTTTLEADAAIGDTTLTVDYAGDFNSVDGGTLDLNGARLAYTGIVDGAQPADPDVIQLANPLTDAAATNDTVSVVAGGQILVDYVAHVTMGIGDEVHVPLDVYQVPMWPLGDYTDPVPVEVSDDLLHLQDAPGRTTTATPSPTILSRMTVFRHIASADYANLNTTDFGNAITNGGSGSVALASWSGFDDGPIGEDITLNSPDDGNININAPGVYAISTWLRASGIQAANTAMDLRFRVRVASPYGTLFDCNARGGDADGSTHTQAFPSASRTYFHPGGANDIYAELYWADFDTGAVTDFIVEMSIQRIV